MGWNLKSRENKMQATREGAVKQIRKILHAKPDAEKRRGRAVLIVKCRLCLP